MSYPFFGPKPPTHQHSCTCRACRTFLRMLLNRGHLGANHCAGFQAVLKHGDIRDVSTVGNGETKRLTPFLMVAGTLTMGKCRFFFWRAGVLLISSRIVQQLKQKFNQKQKTQGFILKFHLLMIFTPGFFLWKTMKNPRAKFLQKTKSLSTDHPGEVVLHKNRTLVRGTFSPLKE